MGPVAHLSVTITKYPRYANCEGKGSSGSVLEVPIQDQMDPLLGVPDDSGGEHVGAKLTSRPGQGPESPTGHSPSHLRPYLQTPPARVHSSQQQPWGHASNMSPLGTLSIQAVAGPLSQVTVSL